MERNFIFVLATASVFSLHALAGSSDFSDRIVIPDKSTVKNQTQFTHPPQELTLFKSENSFVIPFRFGSDLSEGIRAVSEMSGGQISKIGNTWMRGPVEAKGDTVFYDDFSDKDYCLANYTYLDPDNDAILEDNGFYKNRWFWKEDEKLMQFCSDNVHVGNDWLMTPVLHLNGRDSYRLRFDINMGALSNLRVTLGTSSDPKDHQIELFKKEEFHDQSRTSYSVDFMVPEPGDYYIGFYNYNGLDGFYFNLFDVFVEKAFSGLLPAAVDNLEIRAGDNGEEKVYFAFDTPAKKINGDALEGNLKVNIYRDDEKIHTMDAEPSHSYTWEDAGVKSGNHAYRIVCENAEGEGFPVNQTLFVGSDLPDVVGNLTAKVINEGMAVAMSWEAPVKGANDGYFNIEDVTYSVLRSEDGENFTLVQDGIKDLQYTDTSVESALAGRPYQQESFYYAVVAVNPAGNSAANPQFLVVGKPYDIPTGESFPNGQFNIYPWTTNPVIGYFGWECMRSDSDAGMYPQDSDKGFIKFSSIWGDEEVDSRLLTPMISLKGAEDPCLTFFMYHWNEEVEDGGKTTLTIEISEDGGATFKSLCEPIKAVQKEQGWVEHKISLKDYAGKSALRLALRGYMACNWMYYYVDNICIEENMDYDLSVLSVSGPTQVSMNEEISIDFSYYNRGNKVAEGYKLNLYEDDVKVSSISGEPVNPNESKVVEIKHKTSAFLGGKEVAYRVEIEYDADEKSSNNSSPVITTLVSGTWYPTVENLSGKSTDGAVKLTWTKPEIPTEIQETIDGAEDYEPFAISGFGNWLVYDGDQRGSGGHAYLPEHPHYGENQAYQVWSPYYLEPDTVNWEANFPHFLPRSGEQCFISWYASVTVYDYNEEGEWGPIPPWNDDWLISEEVLKGSHLSFYIKRIDPNTANEKYEILYSATDQKIESFVKLEEREAGADWELVELDLPADARYFAIRYVAKECWGIMIDDITYTSAIYGLEVKGYNVFRDGKKLNTELLTSASYEDKEVVKGQTYEYRISAVYNLGESVVSDPILITYDDPDSLSEVEERNITIYGKESCLIVECPTVEEVSVYSVTGVELFTGCVDQGILQIPLNHGTYIVEIAGIQEKVIL